MQCSAKLNRSVCITRGELDKSTEVQPKEEVALAYQVQLPKRTPDGGRRGKIFFHAKYKRSTNRNEVNIWDDYFALKSFTLKLFIFFSLNLCNWNKTQKLTNRESRHPLIMFVNPFPIPSVGVTLQGLVFNPSKLRNRQHQHDIDQLIRVYSRVCASLEVCFQVSPWVIWSQGNFEVC